MTSVATNLSWRELTLTPDKLEWLWQEMNKYATLFSDLTRGNVDSFMATFMDPHTYWLEVLEDDKLIGIVYVSQLYKVFDAEFHVLFFDRMMANKVNVCHEILHHVFEKFPGLHRLTLTKPKMYHATIRLAQKLGFRYEGTKRESQLIEGLWRDEIVMGLLSNRVIDVHN